MFHALQQSVGIYGGALLLGLLSGIIPIVSAEAVLVVLARTVGGIDTMLLLATLMTIGQMLATALKYGAGRGLIKLPMGKMEAKLAKVQARLDKWKDKPIAIIFLSSLTGFPPFYIVSFLAGMFKMSFRAIMTVGTVGRFVRFATIALVPLLF